MKKLLALAVLVGMMSANVFAGCIEPAAAELPDGSKALSQEMIAGQAAVKLYLADALAFLECLASEEKDAAGALTQDQQKTNVATYNSVVEKVKVIVQGYNDQLRVYKEAHAKQ